MNSSTRPTTEHKAFIIRLSRELETGVDKITVISVETNQKSIFPSLETAFHFIEKSVATNKDSE